MKSTSSTMEERQRSAADDGAAAAAGADAVLAKRPLERTADEVQLLAAHLAAQPFFSSMRPDVLAHLCTLVGHARVEEGQPVYAQGHVGDCMYVLVQGSVEILKQQHPTEPGGDAWPGDLARRCSAGDYSSSGGSTAHSSRRATVELQVQQFALATSGSAGVAGASRRVTGAGGSRRVTTEQMVQQQLAESQHLAWLSVGDSFGHAALVNPEQRRPVSVVASNGGATLLVLDRATFNRLQAQAQQEAHGRDLAAATLQAVLAAACRPLLHSSRDSRTAEESETLSELFGGLEAFRALPAEVRARLAKACQGLQLPPGAVVFKEGEEGDSMFVVVSGTLQVRVRAQQTPAQPAAGGGPGLSGTAAAAGANPTAAAGRPMRATADAVLAMHGSLSGMSARAAARRTTWEPGSALTKQQQQQPGRGGDRDAGFWTARFFSEAAAAATASDPVHGLGGKSPLEAALAARWRQQARQQQAVQAAQTAVEDEAAAQDRAFTAMEEMLGKAAARSWKASRDAAASAAGAAQPPGAAPAPATSTSSSAAATPHSSAAGHGGVEQAVGVGAGEPGDTPAAGADSPGGLRSPAAGAGESSPRMGQAPAVSVAGQAAAADASRALLAELGARASLDGLLQAVAGALEKKGLPQRLSKSSSMKITRELNKRMLAGASWQGVGGGSSMHQQQQQPEEPDGASGVGAGTSKDRQNRRTVSFRATGGAGPEGTASADAEAGGIGLDLPAEATGMSSCDWRSHSLDGSETASLCMSVDGEASLESLDLAAAGEGLGGGGCGQQQDSVVASSPPPPAAAQHSSQDLTALFGAVSRVLCTGDSFGELALLQRCAKRTATVVVAPAPSAAEAASGERASSSGGPAAPAAQARDDGALLIKVSRADYDHTVRSLQVAALEGLLAFLGGLPPFAGLSRGALTSLAVFIQPRQVQPGQQVVVAGSPADSLIILQEGELKLLDVATSPAQPGALSRSCRTTSEAVAGVQLAMLCAGSMLGEQVLGFNPDEDPLEAIAAAPHRRARQAAMAAAAALTHPATAVATRPCKLLVLAADDLRRFGRRVRAPLAAAAAARQDWLLQHRSAIRVRVCACVLGGQASMAQVLQASVKQQAPARSSLPADIGHGGGAFAGSASGGSNGQQREQQEAGRRSTAAAGLWPGLDGLLAQQGTTAAAAAALLERQRRTVTAMASSSASAAHRSQWQQQQWAEQAYTLSAATAVQQQPAAVRAADVGRLRQVVPTMQPPCVSELAAAVRPFPSGMLSATMADGAGGGVST